jgi:glycerol-3-phosphate dehydrogenase
VQRSVFSCLEREKLIKHLSKTTFDVLVIGGGITGAGIALDASLRGLNVALVEQYDFASGTSSRSTKLIHGGLRYLKQLEFSLVHQVGTERRLLFQNAPHIVKAEPMLLPIIKGGSLGKIATSIGLGVYDFLAGVHFSERRKMLSAAETMKQEPMLNPSLVLGGGFYYEYRTDDARLLIEVMKSAVKEGAVCINYAAAVEALHDSNGKINGFKVLDKISNTHVNIRAKKVVNAAGPWLDQVRSMDAPPSGKRLKLSKGVHIVIALDKLPIKQAVYFDSPDGRMIFAIPRDQSCYIGTTDTFHDDGPDKLNTEKVDIEYLLLATNRLFPDAKISADDVLSSWVGVRPLIYQEGKKAGELSRKDEIFVAPGGLISIAGGKLTAYRLMAKKTVDLLMNQEKSWKLRKQIFPSTRNYPLGGGNFEKNQSPEIFSALLTPKQGQLLISEWIIQKWVDRYGTNASELIRMFCELALESSEYNLIKAELYYCVAHEAVCTLSDFLIRRTGMLYFEREAIASIYNALNEELAILLQWNEAKKLASLREFEKEYEECIRFRH